jgi:hypothetical protein
VPLTDPRRRGLDLGELPHVAELRFGADFRRDLLEALRAARQKDAAPAARRQEPRGGGPDA